MLKVREEREHAVATPRTRRQMLRMALGVVAAAVGAGTLLETQRKAAQAFAFSQTFGSAQFLNPHYGKPIGHNAYLADDYGHWFSGPMHVGGNLQVTGNISKSGGSFKIDHPIDPANKYLLHSFVESPDMMNIYTGVEVLNADGIATVELPAWFEAPNKDFRYQLTAIGTASPALHVAQEIRDGSFVIAGGSSGLKVSWQVTGIRQDVWANAYRIPVEEEKASSHRGRYLYPEGFGAPVQDGIMVRPGA
jgi:hypothetical protein